jgi:hypothetical protein
MAARVWRDVASSRVKSGAGHAAENVAGTGTRGREEIE